MDYHEAVLEYYDDIYPHDEFAQQLQALALELKQRLTNDGRPRILDLCCGTGRAFSLFSPRDRFEFTGIDVRKNMLAKARSKYRGMQPRLGSVLNIKGTLGAPRDIMSSCFDCVTIFGASITLFDAAERLLIHRQVYDLLRDGGVYVCNTLQGPPLSEENTSQSFVKRVIAKEESVVIVVYGRTYQGPGLPFEQTAYVLEAEQGSEGGSARVGRVPMYQVDCVDLACELKEAGFQKTELRQYDGVQTDFLVAQR